MSRTMIGLAAVMTVVACADQGAVTSPESAGALFSAANSMPCTAEKGQQLIDAGQYKQAINQFTCVIGLDPTAVEGYRGRIEAQLMLGLYSNAFRDYTRVTAFVEPVHTDGRRSSPATRRGSRLTPLRSSP